MQNNEFVVEPLESRALLAADLVASATLGAGVFTTGDSVPLTISVSNEGDATASANFTTTAVLSQDTIFGNGDDTFVYSQPYNRTLSTADAAASFNASFAMPTITSSIPFHLLVRTDSGNLTSDSNRANNTVDAVRSDTLFVNANGVLPISFGDTVDNVTLIGSSTNGTLTVADGTNSQVVNDSDFNSIYLNLGAGNDTLTIGDNVDNVYIDAGLGNDRVQDGDGANTLLGGAGKDTLLGGGGNDRINGAGGNDVIFGQAGLDRLYGSRQNDYIDGGASADRLYGEEGTNLLIGQGGNDTFISASGGTDSIYGSSGTDRAEFDNDDVIASVEFTYDSSTGVGTPMTGTGAGGTATGGTATGGTSTGGGTTTGGTTTGGSTSTGGTTTTGGSTGGTATTGGSTGGTATTGGSTGGTATTGGSTGGTTTTGGSTGGTTTTGGTTPFLNGATGFSLGGALPTIGSGITSTFFAPTSFPNTLGSILPTTPIVPNLPTAGTGITTVNSGLISTTPIIFDSAPVLGTVTVDDATSGILFGTLAGYNGNVGFGQSVLTGL